jgi:hypothetical protein
VTEVAEL